MAIAHLVIWKLRTESWIGVSVVPWIKVEKNWYEPVILIQIKFFESVHVSLTVHLVWFCRDCVHAISQFQIDYGNSFNSNLLHSPLADPSGC